MPNDDNDHNKSIDLTFIARLLISIAIVLLVYGFYLDLGDVKKYLNPETAVENLGEKSDNITMIDIYHLDESVGEMDIDEKSTNKSSGNIKSSDIVTPSYSSTNSNAFSSSEQTNNDLRNSIQKTYGVSVKYGLETVGYTVGGMDTNPIVDYSRINMYLEKLKNAMSLYPDGFFQEIKKGGIPLTIYLIESYSVQGVTGVTDSDYTYANMSIAISYPFDDTFHHENYHYIERYMMKKGIVFSSWSGYNPAGFIYTSLGGHVFRDQSFSRTGSSGAYFVNDYAQSSADEDRASTFEYMMQVSKTTCLDSGQPIWLKATVMSNYIDSVMSCVTPYTQEYWERYL